jgi:dTDP-4-dehydrorhamnose 3,5-epimerase
VTVQRGAIWDVVVDLRVGSPTFGAWDAAVLSESNGKALVIGNGLGHAFLSLQDETTITYLCSEEFNPAREHGIVPTDSTLNIPFVEIARKNGIFDLSFSPKDQGELTLAQRIESGGLPVFL